MTKNQYFKELKKKLKLYSIKDSDEILKDYEEHFNESIINGLTEEEVCEKLGSPDVVASQYVKEEFKTKKKGCKKFLVLTIIFGIIMLYFGITTINLCFTNGPDSNVFWLKEETVYYEDSERLEITLKNLSMKNYNSLELSITATDRSTGSSHILDPFTIKLNALGKLTTQIDLDKVYYENCELSVTYTDNNEKTFRLMQEKDYKPMKIMIIVDSILFVIGVAGFATFLPIYIVKRKQK